MWDDLFGVTARTLVVGRVVTATIALICVLIVCDGWGNLRLRDAVFIVVGPVLGVYLSHVFSATLIQHMQLERRPTWPEMAEYGRLRGAVPLALAVRAGLS
jgi:hypothetical protein